MKSRAVIIANTTGLPGVDIDVSNITSFLKSIEGGAWFDDDIEILRNFSRENLLNRLSHLRREAYDFVMVFFAGHGGRNNNTDLLFLNRENEYIEIEYIKNIAARQINIIDCCRAEVSDEDLAMISEASVALEKHGGERIGYLSARQKYASRIMASGPQQINLFGCSLNECSAETKDGGLYLSLLLMKARKFSSEDRAFQTVISSHIDISQKVTLKAASLGNTQHPDYLSPRIPESRQLIISINPFSVSHFY
ncbi:caspase family protein [Enterobacter roggenkampii]|uniref:caspase family protein n=2 Tax=Enterobacter TaxID=547 RepID=UPI002005E248|nr:caspase family protein [Enterobacter roggenkampii]MCK6941743.1 caspase family protein [Enterobacter roggenkampii]MCM7825389.1 caspase family protein [Enterobacter roggenkampii]WFX56419.1 caspase family protein [Enterobacter roggenkampii]